MARIRDLFRRKPPVISLVAAAYNVAPYIDDFITSILGQDYDLTQVELIIVNDGSTDQTGSVIDDWAAKHPKLVRVIHQPNGGVADARNAGLAQARGAWIGFPDPDDMLHRGYLRHLLAAADGSQVAIVGNLIRYDEAADTHSDTHPMRYRFQRGQVTRPIHKTRELILQSVSHALFDRAAIMAHGIRFDPAVRPTFEDGHFANTLLIHEASRTISFIPEAIYHYRKRADQTSAVDTSRSDLRWYTTQIAAGYLPLITLAQDLHGSVPKFVQVNCLYSMLWRFRYLLDHPDLLGPSDQATLIGHLDRIFAVIDTDEIKRFRCAEMHKVALLARYGRGARDVLRVKGDGQDFHWFVAPDDTVVLTPVINGAPARVTPKPQHQSLFLGQRYVRQDGVTLAVGPADHVEFVASDGRAVDLRLADQTA